MVFFQAWSIVRLSRSPLMTNVTNAINPYAFQLEFHVYGLFCLQGLQNLSLLQDSKYIKYIKDPQLPFKTHWQ